MTDRELLELAAKAFGFGEDTGFIWTKSEWPRNCGIEGALWDCTGHGSTANLWNPLNDDGDALRLAVKLGLYVFIDNDKVSVDAPTITVAERFKDCPYAATRRAIVRAAAAIGSKL